MRKPKILSSDRHSRPLIEQELDLLARKAIWHVQRLPKSARTSGDDSGFESVWEEFKYQVQREQSPFFAAYEEAVREICLRVLMVECGFAEGKLVEQEVQDALYARVYAIASDELLKHDPDDEWARERFEEDQRLFMFGQPQPSKEDQ